MKMILSAVAVMAGLVATDASAQSVNLTGRWQCVASCAAPPGNFAFITQNGWEINMVSDMEWRREPGSIGLVVSG